MKDREISKMIEEFVALLFLSRDYAHRAHLKAKTHAQHLILGEFYENIIDLADRLTEAYQGRYDLIDIPYLEAPTQDEPIAVLQSQLEIIEGTRYDAIPEKDTALQNIVDEVVGQFLSTLYKLRNLK